jgi:hypothetical protein
VAGTGQGVSSLSLGQYEQATRELAPGVLLGALYAGGRGLRAVSETRGTPGTGLRGPRGLRQVELRLAALRERGQQLEVRLGVEGLRELARDIQASREAGRFVAVGGVDAALALREARGNVARAQAWLSKGRVEATGSSVPRHGEGKSLGGVASLVDNPTGLTRKVVEARLAAVELEAAGPRLPGNVAVLEKQRPSLEAPPPGAEANPRWGEYVAYYEKRLGDIQQGKAAKGPLPWESYERMWGWFARGLAFERAMVKVLQADARLPRGARRLLGDFNTPRIEMYVGVKKPGTGLRYADVLVIEEGALAGGAPRVETFSFKSRNLVFLDEEALKAQLIADAREALRNYGGMLDIRRPSLQSHLRHGSEVSVLRIRLIYEGGTLKPEKLNVLKEALEETQRKVPGVEVSFQ